MMTGIVYSSVSQGLGSFSILALFWALPRGVSSQMSEFVTEPTGVDEAAVGRGVNIPPPRLPLLAVEAICSLFLPACPTAAFFEPANASSPSSSLSSPLARLTLHLSSLASAAGSRIRSNGIVASLASAALSTPVPLPTSALLETVRSRRRTWRTRN